MTDEHRDVEGPDQLFGSDQAALPGETPASSEPAPSNELDERAASDADATGDRTSAPDEPRTSDEADEPAISDALPAPSEPDEPAISDALPASAGPSDADKAARPGETAAAADEAGVTGESSASDESTAEGENTAQGETTAEGETGVTGELPAPDESTAEDGSAPWTLVPVMGDVPAASTETPAAAGRQGAESQEPTLLTESEGVRSVDGELARLHLRTGMLALARAELETMAGWSALDREALIDLAEVRWRTGDLVGAGEAAAAYLEVGGDEPIAFCVAAEAALAGGRRADAEAHAAKALELAANRLDELFAGQPRSNLWPAPLARTTPSAAGTPAAAPSWLATPEVDEIVTSPIPGAAFPAATDNGAPGVGSAATAENEPAAGPSADVPAAPFPDGMPASAAGMRPAAGAPPPAGGRSAPGGLSAAGMPLTAGPSPAGPPAADELAEAERRLASGELVGFALRLQVVLRLQPALAPAVLALADAALQAHAPSADEAAAIHLIRSDACRLTGREVLSSAAMQEARRLLHVTTAAEDAP